MKETPLNSLIKFINTQIEPRKLAKSKAVEYKHNLKQLNNSELVAQHSTYLKAGSRNKRY